MTARRSLVILSLLVQSDCCRPNFNLSNSLSSTGDREMLSVRLTNQVYYCSDLRSEPHDVHARVKQKKFWQQPRMQISQREGLKRIARQIDFHQLWFVPYTSVVQLLMT